MLVINESGLYALIFKSRKPQAKEFRKWVTSVVLPSIRKNGFYLQNSLDFEKYPACQGFSDIFSWLRGMDVESNEAARNARFLLIANEKIIRRKLAVPARSSIPFQKDFLQLIESLPMGPTEHAFSATDLLSHCEAHEVFPDLNPIKMSIQSIRAALGRRMASFVGKLVSGHVLTIQGNKNHRRYLFTRVQSLPA